MCLAPVAQRIEHFASDEGVGGSIPFRRATYKIKDFYVAETFNFD